MLLLRLPGVYSPDHDTELLLECVLAEGVPAGARVLDIGTGTGRLALACKAAGAGEVRAVDVSRRAVLATRLNSLAHGLPVRVHRGDLLRGLHGLFDLVVANPPYVPCRTGLPGRHSPARAWDAGPDGRLLLDRICRDAPRHLAPGGAIWLVHSAMCDPVRTLELLGKHGLVGEIVRRSTVPFGPVLRSRASWLRKQGKLAADQNTEELVVIRATTNQRSSRRPVAVRVDPDGPTIVDGPVEILTPNGARLTDERFRVALCACARSRRYPLCDGSHREPAEPPG